MLIGKLPSFQVHWGRYVSMVTGDSEISSDSLEHYDLGMGTRRAKKTVSITDEELLKISSANTNMRFEIGRWELIAMTPVGEHSGYLEARYLVLVSKWAQSHPTQCYGASTGFKLPNGNVRSPDVAVLLPANPSFGKRLESFIPGAPDFLIEIRSRTDSFPLIKTKLREWIESGCRLAFLIDPLERKAYAYRRDGSVTEYPYSATLGGEEVLPGFSVCPAEVDSE